MRPALRAILHFVCITKSDAAARKQIARLLVESRPIEKVERVSKRIKKSLIDTRVPSDQMIVPVLARLEIPGQSSGKSMQIVVIHQARRQQKFLPRHSSVKSRVAHRKPQPIRIREFVPNISGQPEVAHVIIRPLPRRREISRRRRIIEFAGKSAQLRAPASALESPAIAFEHQLRRRSRPAMRQHLHHAANRIRAEKRARRAMYDFYFVHALEIEILKLNGPARLIHRYAIHQEFRKIRIASV